MIGAGCQVADGEVVVILGQLVLVQQHDLVVVAAATGSAYVDDVLQPFDRAGPVFPVVLRRGQRLVGLLSARLDLTEDGLAQIRQVGSAGLGVGVLGLEVGPHGRVVAIPQPMPRVGGLGAVNAPDMRSLRCHRGLRHRERTVPPAPRNGSLNSGARH